MEKMQNLISGVTGFLPNNLEDYRNLDRTYYGLLTGVCDNRPDCFEVNKHLHFKFYLPVYLTTTNKE